MQKNMINVPDIQPYTDLQPNCSLWNSSNKFHLLQLGLHLYRCHKDVFLTHLSRPFWQRLRYILESIIIWCERNINKLAKFYYQTASKCYKTNYLRYTCINNCIISLFHLGKNHQLIFRRLEFFLSYESTILLRDLLKESI